MYITRQISQLCSGSGQRKYKRRYRTWTFLQRKPGLGRVRLGGAGTIDCGSQQRPVGGWNQNDAVLDIAQKFSAEDRVRGRLAGVRASIQEPEVKKIRANCKERESFLIRLLIRLGGWHVNCISCLLGKRITKVRRMRVSPGPDVDVGRWANGF